MNCVNINSPEYKSLVKGMDIRQQFVAKAMISKFMTENGRMPNFIELKSSISDLYNSNKGGIDYNSFYTTVKEMFKSLLPGLSDSEIDQRVKFVDKLELMRLRDGKEVLTSFIDNTVYIATATPQIRGLDAYKDVRHEVFHMLFNNFLSPQEQEKMMESFKRWKPQYQSIMDKEELEEKMADTFEDYRTNPKKTIPILIRDFFVDLLKYLGLIERDYVDIKKLFDDVERGKFTRNFLRDGLVTRDKTILSKYTVFSTNLDLFLQCKSFVLNNLNELMFPEESRNLNENNNGSLFLNQDYKSALFQNNKEIFKLGLTKNDALKMLQKRIDSLANSRDVDPELSKVIKVLSETHILKDMFDYLQPYSLAEVTKDGELVLKSQIEEDPTESLLESDEDYNSLEIGSKELINPITKISEVVKDFLSSISYQTSPNNFVNIDPGAGFIALLNMLGSMYGNTSINDNLQSLKDNYETTEKGNQTKAVYDKLRKLHESIQGYNRIILNIKGMSAEELTQLKNSLDQNDLKYEIFKDNMTVVVPDNMKIENLGSNNVDNVVMFTFNRFKDGKKSFRIVQKSRESNKTFVEKISNETGIPSFVVSKLFKYNEERNQLAELTKVAGSLRKLSPKFVKVSTERVSSEEGVTNITSYAFINKVNDYRTSGSVASLVRDRLDLLPIRADVVATIDRYKDVKEKGDKKVLKDLLKSIVVDKLKIISSTDFERVGNKNVTSLLNNLERIVTFVPEIRGDAPSVEFTASDVYLKHTSNLSNLLNRYIIEKNNPTSFKTSTSNKQKWENVMKNTSWMIFKNLEDFATGLIKADKLLPFIKNSFNNYLRFNPLFNHNYNNSTSVVNKNLLRVGDDDFYSDHQETYFENGASEFTKPPVPFSKESPRDWINRNFLAMFQLPILEDLSKKKDYSYFQQKFQPESAPNVSVIKMGLNSGTEIRNSIGMMILQEAYMNYLGSKSIRKNIRNNTKKSNLPGLEGSTYFIQNRQNVFFDENGNLNEKFGSVVNGKLTLNLNDPLLKGLIKNVLNSLDSSLEEFVDLAVNEKATLSGGSIAEMYSKIKDSYLEEYKLSEDELSSLRGLTINAKTDVEALKNIESYQEARQALKKAMSAYYLNSYVNGFFMNQLSSGSTQNYKNPLDEVKRQAGVNAMNDTGLIDDKHGMPTSYRNVVIKAANNFYGESHPFAKIPVLQRFFRNKKQEVGDAQSWDLPEYKQMLRKSFGKSVDIGVITKDVHFEINNDGYVDYRKTSSAELTNELVRKNKTLRDLRYALTFQPYLKSLSDEERTQIQPRIDYLYNKFVDEGDLANVDEYMEYQDILDTIQEKGLMIHKASFESAVKGSKPAKMSEFVKNPETGTFDFVLEDDSILTLNSAYNGIQQAIRHRYIDSFISHFTQLTYLIGLNRTDTSIKNNRTITRSLSRFAKSGMFDTLFDYRMAYSEDKLLKANTRSKKEFIKDLVKKLDLPGNERIVSLLNTPKISMNNPLFSEKLMQTFFNSLSKKTVAPKHPGGSFVLQSEFGFEANQVLKENSLRPPVVATDKDKNVLYAECYLPEMYSQQIQAGSLIYYNSDEYNKMFGFRIPSSDLHSSVPLKVIGYYPSRQHDNVIVIPAAVTALHGSDFDVDKLFVVRYGVFGQDDEDIDPKAVDQEQPEPNVKKEYKTRFQGNNVVIAQKGIKFGYKAPNALYNTQGNIIDFGDQHTQVFNVESVLLDEKQKTQAEILRLEAGRYAFDTETKGMNLTKKFEKNQRSKQRREQFTDPLKAAESHLKTLRTIQRGLYSNQILDAVLDNISYSGENAEDIFFGITFDPVKGYEETSEYSELARVFSDINKAKGIEDLLPERPTLYKTLEEAKDADTELYTAVEEELRDNLGVDPSTEKGKIDHLALINEELKDEWVSERDAFIGRQRGSGSVNINKVEQHVTVHKETYMAAGLVGLIANFSKGLAYAFHGITNDKNVIELNISEKEAVKIDGQIFNSLTLSNKDNIKNQELRSLALNAAIDHVKEQILNVLNVGNNTAKIFLAAISTEMSLHQASMLMLQPVAKELNSSNATTVSDTLKKMEIRILDKAKQLGKEISLQEISELEVTTKDLEKFIQTDLNTFLQYSERKDLLLQYKAIQQLRTLNQIGNEISEVSQSLSIIQGLPYSLEVAYDKLNTINKFIDIEKFYNKLEYNEKSEYTKNGFKDDLRSDKNILQNVNLAYNENVLAALEGIKQQIDIASEMFSENSVQAQFLVNGMLKAVSNNSDPSTMFSSQEGTDLTFDTTKNMSTKDKYLKGKSTFNVFKVISRNIFNYLTSGLYMSYNDDNHLFTLSLKDQQLLTLKKDDKEFQLSAVRSFIDAFLMKEGDAKLQDGTYNGDNFVISQINPEWRLKPLTVIKRENTENRFLRGLGVDTNFRDKIRIMTFDNSSVNTAENLAEVEQAVNDLNSLTGIYVVKDKKGKWVDLPSNEHPYTSEMNEITFNMIKTSLYTDKFKFGMSRASNVIPPIYYQGLFQSLETLIKDLFYYKDSTTGNKYYKDFSNIENETNQSSALNNIKENLFINTIFSIPTVLPNLKNVLPNTKERFKHVFKQAGILPNGNIYDLYLDADVFDKKEKEDDPSILTTMDEIEKTEENTNSDVTQDLSETQAENDLLESFRKNPSFIVDEAYNKRGTYEIFMKVGTSGTKDESNQKYYYKKVATVNGKLTNNSFNLDLLLNKYKIQDYYNPQRLAIPVKGIDFSGKKIVLNNVKISSFLITASDDARTQAQNAQELAAATEEQMEILRNDPKNKNKTDAQLKREVKTKLNVENVINNINEVSLYDGRNLDRLGIRSFKIVSRKISDDKKTVDFELEELPISQQISFKTNDAPLVMLNTVRDSSPKTREEKIAYINSIPGGKVLTSAVTDEMTDAQIDVEYRRAVEAEEEREINKVLKDKNC